MQGRFHKWWVVTSLHQYQALENVVASNFYSAVYWIEYWLAYIPSSLATPRLLTPIRWDAMHHRIPLSLSLLVGTSSDENIVRWAYIVHTSITYINYYKMASSILVLHFCLFAWIYPIRGSTTLPKVLRTPPHWTHNDSSGQIPSLPYLLIPLASKYQGKRIPWYRNQSNLSLPTTPFPSQPQLPKRRWLYTSLPTSPLSSPLPSSNHLYR